MGSARPPLRRPPPPAPALLVALLAGLHPGPAAAQTEAGAEPDAPPAAVAPPVPPPPADRAPPEVVDLPAFEVVAGEEEDPAGVVGGDAELAEPPFGSDLVFFDGDDDLLAEDLADAFDFAAGTAGPQNPTDSLLGGDNLNLRGFPTPSLRDGFTQTGLAGLPGTAGGRRIGGALVAPAGRAAPGGINDARAARPARAATSVSARAATTGRVGFTADASRPVRKRPVFTRVRLAWDGTEGPQDFAETATAYAGLAVSVRHAKTLASLFNLDFERRGASTATATSYKETPAAPVTGPYRPLLEFNPNGPRASGTATLAAFAWQIDAAPTPDWSVRATVQGYRRETEEDRFRAGPYVVSTGRLAGVREPLHLATTDRAWSADAEITRRIVGAGGVHKVRASVEATEVHRSRDQRALEDADLRRLLPPEARFLDPAAPDWTFIPYDPALYRRILADRLENPGYQAASADVRSSLLEGRLVTAAGVRVDFVDVTVRDDRPGAPQAAAAARSEQASGFASANWTVAPGRLLAYGGLATAFNPSTRIDSRTGALQGNATTMGYEAGLRARLLGRTLDLALGGFWLENQNISRRNPLLGDPVFDADLTQPELVAGGEERFAGATASAAWRFREGWNLNATAAWTDAITTASPDIPEEVGRPLTGLPPFRASGSLRGPLPDLRGVPAKWSFGFSGFYLSGYTASYGDAARRPLEYPGYSTFSASLAGSWTAGKTSHQVALTLANAFDTDLEELLARAGAGRSLSGSYTVRF